MPLGTATSKTTQITYFWLEGPHDFIDLTTDLIAIGCEGHIAGTAAGWSIDITGPVNVIEGNSGRMTAVLDDVLLWDNVTLRKTTKDRFVESWTVDTP